MQTVLIYFQENCHFNQSNKNIYNIVLIQNDIGCMYVQAQGIGCMYIQASDAKQGFFLLRVFFVKKTFFKRFFFFF